MSNISTLKDSVNMKTWHLVLITVLTSGIFPVMWMYLNSPKIEDVTKMKLFSSWYTIAIATCIGFFLSLQNSYDEDVLVFAGLFVIASSVLYIVWAFKAKKVLEEYCINNFKIDLRMNAFYTFIFNVFYINYCINDMPEVLRKNQIISSGSPVNSQQSGVDLNK